MNIGQAARLSGMSAKMIRYYEEIGLLHSVARSETGYRLYTAQEIKTLQFIQHARQLGFSMQAIKDLVGLWKNENRQSAEVKRLTLSHIQQLNQKIADLQAMVAVLEHSVNACADNDASECEILNHLEYRD
jgi:MerR family transcriptional regulator, copper efflux regulator